MATDVTRARGADTRYAYTRVRTGPPTDILSGMTTQMPRIPARPTLDGLEDKWTQRWAKERVVQV